MYICVQSKASVSNHSNWIETNKRDVNKEIDETIKKTTLENLS